MKTAVLMICILATVTVDAALEVREGQDGFSVLRDGVPVVERVRLDRGDIGEEDVKASFAKREDGAKVWNRWSETRDRRFRLEVAQRADGAVEITMASQMDPDSLFRRRFLRLDLPDGTFRGKSFEAIGSSYKRVEEKAGTMEGASADGRYRWLTADGVNFDFHPLGVANILGGMTSGEGWAHVDAVRGAAEVVRGPDGWCVSMGDDVKSSYGGYLGAKIVIREGVRADYARHHLRDVFSYAHTIPPRKMVALGAPKRGAAYADGDVAYSDAAGFGWVAAGDEKRTLVGHPEGAFYSSVSGRGTAAYRFGGLPDGWWIFTFAAGNATGAENRFTVTAGGATIASDVSVGRGRLRTLVKAVHVSGGALDVTLAGDWLVSTMAVQPMHADGEDFMISRGFWMTDGYEPGVLYRSAEWHPFAPGLSDGTETLPVPGREFAEPLREPPAPVELPDPGHPGLAWTRNTRIHRIFNNSSTLAELDIPEVREAYLDRELGDGKANTVMLSGTLVRHAVPARREAMLVSVSNIVASLHRRGIKVFDHIDLTLLGGYGIGNRLILDNPEIQRRDLNRLVSNQICLVNPAWRGHLLDELERKVASGVDALQLDEVILWGGCTCRHCREAFRRDTGWEMPLNECDPCWADKGSPFQRVWRDWRIKVCTNFFVELRRRTKHLNDHLVLSAYSYTRGFLASGCGDNGQELLDLVRAVNFFGMEVMSRNVFLSSRAELPHRRSLNILGMTYGAPLWDWYYNFNWEGDYAAWAMSEMCRQSPMLSEVKRTEATPDYVGFGASPRAMDRRGATAIAPVAVYFSSRTRDLPKKRPWAGEMMGIAQALEALHIPYEFVPDVGLSADCLGKYKVLFLTGTEDLTEKESALFADYEKRGGRLVRGVSGAGRFCMDSIANSVSFLGQEKFTFDPDPAAETAFRKTVGKLVGNAGWWTVDAPADVATSVWRERTGALAIHFLNLTGAHPKPGDIIDVGVPAEAYPPLKADIVFTVPEGSRAVAVSPDFSGEKSLVAVKDAKGGLTVTLPKELLRVYTLVRVIGSQTRPVFDVRAFGATGDGATKDTAAIQAAVDAAVKAGGGEVRLPSGIYLSGSVRLGDGVDFHLEKGAVLKGSPDLADYCAADCVPQNAASKLENTTGGHLIWASDAKGITLRGPGRIDGNSPAFFINPKTKKPYPKRSDLPGRPGQMIWFVDSKGIRIHDLQIYSSPYWSCFLLNCDDIEIGHCDVRSLQKEYHSHNGDGFDLDRCRNVRLGDCTFATSDDCITFRASAGNRLAEPHDCENVVVSNCVLSGHYNGLRFGVGEGRIHDILVKDVKIHNLMVGIVLSCSYSWESRGTDIYSVKISGVTVDSIRQKFLTISRYRYLKSDLANLPEIHDIEISDVTGSLKGTKKPSDVNGAPGKPFRNIVFRNVDLEGCYAVSDADVRAENCTWRRHVMQSE